MVADCRISMPASPFPEYRLDLCRNFQIRPRPADAKTHRHLHRPKIDSIVSQFQPPWLSSFLARPNPISSRRESIKGNVYELLLRLRHHRRQMVDYRDPSPLQSIPVLLLHHRWSVTS